MFIQFCQGAVDRGEAYPMNLFLDMVQYASGRGMLIGGKKVVEDGIPLRSDSQASFSHLDDYLVFGTIRTNNPTPYPE